MEPGRRSGERCAASPFGVATTAPAGAHVSEVGVQQGLGALSSRSWRESGRRRAVIVEVGEESFTLTGTQVEMLIYKLSGMAHGAYPRDMQLLAGDEWLPPAGELANALQAAQSDEEGKPVRAGSARAFCALPDPLPDLLRRANHAVAVV